MHKTHSFAHYAPALLCINNLSCCSNSNGVFDEPVLDSEYAYIVNNYGDAYGRINLDDYLHIQHAQFTQNKLLVTIGRRGEDTAPKLALE